MRTFNARSGAVVVGFAIAAACAGCGGTPGAVGTTAMPSISGMSSVSGASSVAGGGSLPMAMPIMTLGQATWQGMSIQARSMAPAEFVVVTGTKERLVRPTKNDSIHLMVVLSDALTHTPIPYASVWATIRKQGKIVYDERQWPMISRYMGVHYGNNVALRGAGEYTLDLLISPPQSARHMEYAHIWLKPHHVQFTFHWKPGM